MYVKTGEAPIIPNLDLSPVAKNFWKKKTVEESTTEDESTIAQDQPVKKKLKLLSKALTSAAKTETSKPAAKKATPYENRQIINFSCVVGNELTAAAGFPCLMIAYGYKNLTTNPNVKPDSIFWFGHMDTCERDITCPEAKELGILSCAKMRDPDPESNDFLKGANTYVFRCMVMMPQANTTESIRAKANDFVKQLNNDEEKPVFRKVMESYKSIPKFNVGPIKKFEDRPLAFYLAIDDIITMLEALGCPVKNLVSEGDPEDTETEHALLDFFFGDHDDEVKEMIRGTIEEMEKNGKQRNYISTL